MLSKQTVWTETERWLTEYQVCNEDGCTPVDKKEGYFLTEEQLREVIGNSFEAGKKKESAWNKYQSRRDDFYAPTYNKTPDKEQYISELLK